MPPTQLSANDREDPGLRNGPDALHIPDVVLHILAHVDAPTLLSLRLVSSFLNSIIDTHQHTVCKSILWRDFAIDLDFCPPAMRDRSKYHHLRTSLRARKAQALASDAIAKKDFWFDCQEEGSISDPGYYVLVAHCTRGILIIWTLNDIQELVCPSHRLPTYISTSTHSLVSDTTSRHHRRFGSLYRLLVRKIKISSAFNPKREDFTTESGVADLSNLTLAPTINIEAETYLGKVRSAQYQYLRTLDRTTRIDFELEQEDLLTLVPRYFEMCCLDSLGPTNEHVLLRRRFFALQQVPRFILSVVSTNEEERKWAWDVVKTASARPGLVQEIENYGAMPCDFLELGESRDFRNGIIQEAYRVRSAAARETNERRHAWRVVQTVVQVPPTVTTIQVSRAPRRLLRLSRFT